MRTPALLIIVGIVVVLLWGFVFGGRLPKPFGVRSCQGRSWRELFPLASKQQIREFLSLFVAAFTYDDSEKLKLNPGDSLLSIYKARYRRSWQPDALEFEALALDFKKRYGIELESVWRDDLTPGELFSCTLVAQ